MTKVCNNHYLYFPKRGDATVIQVSTDRWEGCNPFSSQGPFPKPRQRAMPQLASPLKSPGPEAKRQGEPAPSPSKRPREENDQEEAPPAKRAKRQGEPATPNPSPNHGGEGNDEEDAPPANRGREGGVPRLPVPHPKQAVWHHQFLLIAFGASQGSRSPQPVQRFGRCLAAFSNVVNRAAKDDTLQALLTDNARGRPPHFVRDQRTLLAALSVLEIGSRALAEVYLSSLRGDKAVLNAFPGGRDLEKFYLEVFYPTLLPFFAGSSG
jgi:hypothetical protein